MPKLSAAPSFAMRGKVEYWHLIQSLWPLLGRRRRSRRTDGDGCPTIMHPQRWQV
jgi:hypothetical protein